MRFKLLLAAAAAALTVTLVPSPAFAQVDGQDGTAGGGSSPLGQATITADIGANALGFRAVTLTTVAPMTSVLNALSLSGAYSVTVTETLRSGTNPWSVTGSLAGDLTSGSNTIDEQYVSLQSRAFSATLGGGGTSSVPSGTAPLGDTNGGLAVTIGSNASQSATTLYSGVYSATGSMVIDPPSGTQTGIYTGTFVVDLVQ
jgi:hypothetical protein